MSINMHYLSSIVQQKSLNYTLKITFYEFHSFARIEDLKADAFYCNNTYCQHTCIVENTFLNLMLGKDLEWNNLYVKNFFVTSIEKKSRKSFLVKRRNIAPSIQEINRQALCVFLCVFKKEGESINYTNRSSRLYFRREWPYARFAEKCARWKRYGTPCTGGRCTLGRHRGRLTWPRYERAPTPRRSWAQKKPAGKRKKVIVGVWQSVSESGGGPSIPALLDRVTVGRGSYTHGRTFGQLKGMKITKRLVSFFSVRPRLAEGERKGEANNRHDPSDHVLPDCTST